MDSPSAKTSSAVRAAPWAILACLLWSSAFAGVKIGLAYVPPLTFAGMRFILAGCLLLPFCGGPRGVASTLRRHGRLVLTVSFFQTIVLYGAFFWGMSLVGGAQGAVIIGASPLAAALLAHFFMADDRMTLGKAGTIALGMAGVVVLAAARQPWEPAGRRELAGMGLLLISVVSSAAAGVTVARHRREINPLALNSLQMGLGGVVLLALGMVVDGPPRALPPLEFFGALLWLASISAAGFSIWFTWLRRVKVSQLNMWKFLIPLFGAGLSWLLVEGESPDVPTAAGMVCVATAVLVNQLLTLREERRAARGPVPGAT